MGVAAKLEDLNRKLKRWGDSKDDVTVYLASCIVSNNYHNPPCPHKEYIKEIVERLRNMSPLYEDFVKKNLK